MSFKRSLKRRIESAYQTREILEGKRCPKCKIMGLKFKNGYGIVCPECGWWKEMPGYTPSDNKGAGGGGND